jgi:hypothetical protein
MISSIGTSTVMATIMVTGMIIVMGMVTVINKAIGQV